MKDMDKILDRIITTGHVAVVMQTHDRQARREMKKIKKHFGKARHQLVFLRELLDYTGFSPDYVLPLLKWSR